MNWERFLPWIASLAVFAGVLWLQSQRCRPNLAPPPGVTQTPPGSMIVEPVDLTLHDGATIDLSSGWPVVKDSPADRAANERAEKDMEEATKDVAFSPAKPAAADKKPTEPPKN